MKLNIKLSKGNRAIILAYRKGWRMTETGRLYSPSGKEFKNTLPITGNRGYPHFTVYIGKEHGKRALTRTINIHRFAAYCFYGIKVFRYRLVRHLDGNKLNNAKSNLAFGDDKDNYYDQPAEQRRRSITRLKSVQQLGVAKIRLYPTYTLRQEIRRRHADGFSFGDLALIYGGTRRTISNLINKRTYIYDNRLRLVIRRQRFKFSPTTRNRPG